MQAAIQVPDAEAVAVTAEIGRSGLRMSATPWLAYGVTVERKGGKLGAVLPRFSQVW